MPRLALTALSVTVLCLAGCDAWHRSEGERLARGYCGACHAFPEPELLDKATWEKGVLPQMAPRVGIQAGSLFDQGSRNPHMVVLTSTIPQGDWDRIVAYYRDAAPASLPAQALRTDPQVDPDFFATGPFAPRIASGGIITLLETDPINERIFVGEAGTDVLRVFDWNRRLVSSLALSSAPTDLIVAGDEVLILESGILHPNDEPRGRLARYRFSTAGSLQLTDVLIDSLFRPVSVQSFDFNRDGRNDYVIAEYGNNRGRLSLYRSTGSRFERQVLDPGPGAIRTEIHDLTGDGSSDIVALFGQGDERIALFTADAKGRFGRRPRLLARFPPVYGSMYFTMRDFNGDGRMDIVYANGDNFDYSRVLKPYHGVRILENEGNGTFAERFFFPMYGAARAEVADFDRDGDLDILATSNFADRQGHPERGIAFLESTGRYDFRPHAFTIASRNRWNLTTTADMNKDGWLDVIVGAMDLDNIANLQRRTVDPVPSRADSGNSGNSALLLFENRMQSKRAR